MGKITKSKQQVFEELQTIQDNENVHFEIEDFKLMNKKDLILLLLNFKLTDSCVYPKNIREINKKLDKIESYLVEIENKLAKFKLK